MDAAPIENGAVRIRGNRIIDVGKFSKSDDNEIIDLGERVLLPGLINAHCHLEYTCLRGKIPPPGGFAEWIRAINAEKAKLAPDDFLRTITEGFAEAQRFGTTSIVNLEAFPDLIARAKPSPLRTWWCAELIDVNTPAKSEQIVSVAVENLKNAQKERGGIGLAPHALFTASGQLYRQCEKRALHEGFLRVTHLAESEEEMEMFRDRSGRLFEFLQSLGRSMEDCGGTTPLELFLGELHVKPQDSATSLRSAWGDGWIIAHLNQLTDADFDLLADLRPGFTIAHCPRSHSYFGHTRFAFERLNALGLNICLATDSLASNDDLSLFSEMRQFRTTHPGISARDVLTMVTLNPGEALSPPNRLGRIRPGFLADLIAIPAMTAKRPEIYDTIIEFDEAVPWMMIGGAAV